MRRSEAIVLSTLCGLATALLHRARSKRRAAAQAAPPAQPPPQEEKWEAQTCRMPARLTKADKAALLASVSLEDRREYFALSVCPVTEEVEQRMEQVSSVASREIYNDHWEAGGYRCARCTHPLYSSGAKFVGPCLWPSFREGAAPGSLHTIKVPRGSYNNYKCEVHELYCGGCKLFLGHQFEDGRNTGDTHPDARWRHCVLSLSMQFAPGERA